MMSAMYRILLIAGVLTTAGTLSPASAEVPRSVYVQTGQSVVLDERAVERVAVGDSNIISIRAIGTSQLLLTGRAPGHTTAVVWLKGRHIDYVIEVSEESADRLAAMLQSAIPFAGVTVRAFDHAIVARGSVSDPAELAVLNDVISRFDKLAAARKYAVVNAVTVVRPL